MNTNEQYFFNAENLAQGSQLDLEKTLQHLSFNDKDLIPVITQRYDTGEVLMMAWMNREALDITLQEGYMCYWSRSRNQLWRKGETSGNTQKLIELRIDCDGDCLLCLVEQTGPACHTGRSNCFYLGVNESTIDILNNQCPL